jgi:hypothetical protein
MARQKISAAEQQLFDSANRERAARRLAPLKWDPALARAAHKHAVIMARRNALSHQFPGEPILSTRGVQAKARFVAIAENVAEGRSAANIHGQWMGSPPHRENLLDPGLDSLGVAVAARRGQLFAVEDFSRAVADLTLEQQEKQVEALLKARGLQLLDSRADARQTCGMQNGSAGKRHSLYVIRYETAELKRLPGNLQKQISSGKFHSAAVGACSTSDASAFASYRIAVLLY